MSSRVRVGLVSLSLVLGFLGAPTATADTLVATSAAFAGPNLYAPTVIYDGAYKMWYSAWQSVGQTSDVIYYRTSPDNLNWGAYQAVLTPAAIGTVNGSVVMHVADPSVTKHINQVTGAVQYTMFYTICVAPCNQSDNQVWSSVSANGVNWTNHKMLLAGSTGPSEPSAIIEQLPNGTFWRVYYIDRLQPTVIKMATVDGNRNATSATSVLATSDVMANPSVGYFNGQWHIFYNVYTGEKNGYPERGNIKKAVSAVNTAFYNPTLLIAHSGAPFCATLGPGVLPVAGNQYDLYFGLNEAQPDGTCDFTKNTSIQRWRFAE